MCTLYMLLFHHDFKLVERANTKFCLKLTQFPCAESSLVLKAGSPPPIPPQTRSFQHFNPVSKTALKTQDFFDHTINLHSPPGPFARFTSLWLFPVPENRKSTVGSLFWCTLKEIQHLWQRHNYKIFVHNKFSYVGIFDGSSVVEFILSHTASSKQPHGLHSPSLRSTCR